MSQTHRNTKGLGEDQSPAVLSQYCVQEASSPLQKLHLTLQEAGQGTEVCRRCKTKLSFGRELLVPCLHTGSDTLLEGALGGSSPGCSAEGSLLQPRSAQGCPSTGVPCPASRQCPATPQPSLSQPQRGLRESGVWRGAPAAFPGAARQRC